MSNIAFRYVQGDGVATVTAFDPSREQPILSANEYHPHFSTIVDLLQKGDTAAFGLFDVVNGVGYRLRQITERISYDGTDIRWDGDPVHTVLADQLKRALDAGESNYEALARFWEKLESNPNDHSKKQAYRWLSTHDFKITPDGDVVGYKGVVGSDKGEESAFWSISSSNVPDAPSGYVNGVPVKPLSTIKQGIGDVVTMPRSEVKHDPNVHCHRGLHVGDWSYARSFARGAVLEVHVNPRDIVSVPNDAGYRKVRVCKYKVVRVVTEEYKGGPIIKPAEVQESWGGDVSYKV